MHELGALVLERVLNGAAAPGLVKCTLGHEVVFVDHRSKRVTTVWGAIQLRRGYYYCDQCGKGVLPRDEELDLVGTSFSPGVRKLMGWMGGKESFAEAGSDIALLAGIKVKTKSVERVAEGIGAQLEVLGHSERAQAMAENVVIALRCIQLSGRWEEIWEMWAAS